MLSDRDVRIKSSKLHLLKLDEQRFRGQIQDSETQIRRSVGTVVWLSAAALRCCYVM